MSVLINMEMPTSCADCRFAVDGWCYACPPESEAERQRITTNYCPLVPVPKHGRLGDLNELEKTFREDANFEWNRFACPVNWADAFDDVADMIADAPTIIPAEEGK